MFSVPQDSSVTTLFNGPGTFDLEVLPSEILFKSGEGPACVSAAVGVGRVAKVCTFPNSFGVGGPEPEWDNGSELSFPSP